jgi:hypothetical protein
MALSSSCCRTMVSAAAPWELRLDPARARFRVVAAFLHPRRHHGRGNSEDGGQVRMTSRSRRTSYRKQRRVAMFPQIEPPNRGRLESVVVVAGRRWRRDDGSRAHEHRRPRAAGARAATAADLRGRRPPPLRRSRASDRPASAPRRSRDRPRAASSAVGPPWEGEPAGRGVGGRWGREKSGRCWGRRGWGGSK